MILSSVAVAYESSFSFLSLTADAVSQICISGMSVSVYNEHHYEQKL